MQVHRFRDRVTLHLIDGQTHMLSPKAARALAATLYEYARDVESSRYLESRLTSERFDKDSRRSRRLGVSDVVTADQYRSDPNL